MRSAHESLAVQYFARNACPEDLTRLDDTLTCMRECAGHDGSLQEMTDLDIRFHESIVGAARHHRLLEGWLNLREQFWAVLPSRNVAHQDCRQLVHTENHAVLDALRTGEVDQMLDITAQYVGMAYVRLVRSYGGADAGGGGDGIS